MFATFLGSLVSLVFCMAVGYVCRKLHLLNDSLNAGLTALLVKVTLPCTVFMSFMRPFSKTLLSESAVTFLLATAVYLCGGLLAIGLACWLKPSAQSKRIWMFSLIFANVGYMGFPVSQAIFGGEGMIYTSMANASFNILAFTVGVRLFNPKTTETQPKAFPSTAAAPASFWRMLVVNPALLCTLAGFSCFVTGLRLPGPINDGIAMIGAMTTPVSMLLVGAILAKNPLKSLFTDIKALPVIAVRLAVIPLAAFFVLRLFLPNPVMLGVIVVLAAMPVASLTAIFAEQYGGDTALASRLVALSTLLCVLTVPLFTLLLF